MRKTQLALTVLMVITTQSALRAAELKVVDVRRNIPLSDDEPPVKDFYINGGAKDGLKPNLVVTAVRKTSVRDASGTQNIGELSVPVAQLRVVFVQDNISVAREHKSLSRDELPMVEQVGVMSGDYLDLKGSFIEKRKPASVTAVKNTDSTTAPSAGLILPSAENAAPGTPPLPQVPQTAPMKAIIGNPPKTEARIEGDQPVPR